MKKLLKNTIIANLIMFMTLGMVINSVSAVTSYLPQEIRVTHLKNSATATTSSSANISISFPGHHFHFLSEALTLDGVDRAYDVYYYVPKAELGHNNYIELHFSHSSLLLASQSTLTVLVDNRPLQSIFLTEETSQQGQLKINLGEQELTPGYHQLTLFKHSVVSDDLCRDQYNPANWVKIAPSSSIFLDTLTTWTTEDPLKDFPHPFVESGTPEEIYSTIVVPDKPSAELISTALYLATHLSAQTGAKKHLPIITESEWLIEEMDVTHVLALGSLQSWSGPLKQIIEDNHVSIQEKELALDVFAVTNPEKGLTKHLLLISAVSDQTLQEKIHILTAPELRKQLTGNHLIIKETPRKESLLAKEQQLSFSSFGYGHLLLDEVNHVSDSYFFNIPSYWQITGDSFLELKIKLSPLVQNELEASRQLEKDRELGRGSEEYLLYRNGLTVFINEVPTTFALGDLEPIQAGSDLYRVSIPLSEIVPNLSNGGLLEISFVANISDLGGVCYKQRNSGRWIFIDQESSLQLPHQVLKNHSFQYWPAPFVNDQGVEQTTFFIPEKINGKVLTQLSLLANELVIQTENQQQIIIYQDRPEAPVTEKLEQYNVIIVGELNQYPSLQNKEEDFLIHSNHLADYQVINETTEYIAWIQPSIWNKEKTMAVFQKVDHGGKDDGRNKELYVHPLLLQQLKAEQTESHIAVMSKSNDIFTIGLSQTKEPDSPTSLMKETIFSPTEEQLEQEVPLWILILIPLIFVILLIAFIFIWRRQKRKSS